MDGCGGSRLRPGAARGPAMPLPHLPPRLLLLAAGAAATWPGMTLLLLSVLVKRTPAALEELRCLQSKHSEASARFRVA